PYAAGIFGEVSERVYGGISFGEVGEGGPLGGYPHAPGHVAREAPRRPHTERQRGARAPLPAPQLKAKRGEIRLVAYKPLFSGAAVERVTELQFQRPQPELELAAEDARRRRIATGDLVIVGSNGSAITLPARVNRRLRAGIARVARVHAEGFGGIRAGA